MAPKSMLIGGRELLIQDVTHPVSSRFFLQINIDTVNQNAVTPKAGFCGFSVLIKGRHRDESF